AIPQGYGRDQHTVRTHVHIVADHGLVLVGAVVVGGDAAGAVVHALAHFGIAQVGQVVGLGALGHGRVLDLDEVADVHLGAQLGPRSQACEGPDQRAIAHGGALRVAIDVGEGMDDH